MGEYIIEPGSAEWEEWRHNSLNPIPGKFSALYFFASEVLRLKDVVPMTPYTHLPMCLFAEHATGIPEIDSARIQLIQVPRGVGKSTAVTVARSVQRLMQYDNYSIGIANETQNMAENFLGGIKTQFEQNDLLRALFPERVPPDFSKTQWSASKITIARTQPRRDPSVLAAGVGATVTGTHVNEWICDDLLSQNLAENAIRGLTTEVDALNRWVMRLPPLLVNSARDPITFIGTPWYEGDSYDFITRFFGEVPDEVEDLDEYIKEYGLHRLWQLKLPDGRSLTIPLVRVGDLAIFRRPAEENGRSIFPERFTLEELEKERARPGNAWFIDAQYYLNPTAPGSSEFEESWLKSYIREDSTVNPGEFVVTFHDEHGQPDALPKSAFTFVMSVDPAFGKKASHARTAIPVTGIYKNKVFLFEDFAEHGMGTYDIANKVVDFYLRYRPQRIYLETIAAQKALVEPIQRTAVERIGHELPIEDLPSQQKAKTIRIYGLQHYFKSGRFYVPLHGCKRFRSEYRVFPKGALRDILDAITFQVEEWERIFRMGSRQSTSNRMAGWDAGQIARIKRSLAPKRR